MTPQEEMEKYEEELSRQEALEHQNVLMAIRGLLKQQEGLTLFKYLFKNLDVTKLPERGMTGEDLQDYLGFLRAGNSIYKLACEADADIAASMLSDLERKRYEHKHHIYRIENGLTTNSNADTTD